MQVDRHFYVEQERYRPVYGYSDNIQDAFKSWKDLILFYEYFNGDNGSGLGASHQTGWTGLVANLISMNMASIMKSIIKNHKPM